MSSDVKEMKASQLPVRREDGLAAVLSVPGMGRACHPSRFRRKSWARSGHKGSNGIPDTNARIEPSGDRREAMALSVGQSFTFG